MTAKISIPQLDALIQQSKQITSDLMSLRHELQRAAASHSSERQIRNAKERLSLALDNNHSLSVDMFALWEALHERSKATHATTLSAAALGNGRLQLTKGGR